MREIAMAQAVGLLFDQYYYEYVYMDHEWKHDLYKQQRYVVQMTDLYQRWHQDCEHSQQDWLEYDIVK